MVLACCVAQNLSKAEVKLKVKQEIHFKESFNNLHIIKVDIYALQDVSCVLVILRCSAPCLAAVIVGHEEIHHIYW
jgi:hypothetical protein